MRGERRAGRARDTGQGPAPVLIITADDYGYAPAYDEGIVAAAAAGAIDAVSVLVLRDPDPRPLQALAARAEGRAGEEGARLSIGLHLERLGVAPPAVQRDRFRALFGSPPAYLDGHHHCHAERGVAAAVAIAARRWGIPVRSVDDAHRRLLREHGVATPDRLLGRLGEHEPSLPEPLRAVVEPGGGGRALAALAGVSEWMTHPGHPDPGASSSYDRGRAEDLELLLGLGDREAWAKRGIRRATHAEALGGGLPAARCGA